MRSVRNSRRWGWKCFHPERALPPFGHFIIPIGEWEKTLAFKRRLLVCLKGPKTAECRTRNIECRSDPFAILRFLVQYSIFNVRRSVSAGKSNSFDKAMSARQAIGSADSRSLKTAVPDIYLDVQFGIDIGYTLNYDKGTTRR